MDTAADAEIEKNKVCKVRDTQITHFFLLFPVTALRTYSVVIQRDTAKRATVDIVSCVKFC